MVCLEATGVYGEALCYYLAAKGYQVAVESPQKVKRAFDESGHKTDVVCSRPRLLSSHCEGAKRPWQSRGILEREIATSHLGAGLAMTEDRVKGSGGALVPPQAGAGSGPGGTGGGVGDSRACRGDSAGRPNHTQVTWRHLLPLSRSTGGLKGSGGAFGK